MKEGWNFNVTESIMDVINVYIPRNIIDLSSGYLNGLMITGNYETEKEPRMIVIDEEVQNSFGNECVGKIYKYKEEFHYQENSLWVNIVSTPFSVTVYINGKVISMENINLIFYNPLEIKESLLLSESNGNNSKLPKSMKYFLRRVKKNDNSVCSLNTKSVSKSMTIILRLYQLFTYINILIITFNEFLTKIFDTRSVSMLQAVHRFKQIESIVKYFHRREKLIVIRILGVLITDILLGLLSFCLISYWTSALELHLMFQSATKIVTENVEDLLEWLKDAPAGLKLNQPLAESLSGFFSYHLYLWTLYLEIASPALAVFANLFVYVGAFGISLQIALMVDFLNLAVLHIYCLYIYAARIHMIQISLLGSQWRGFRGKKSNPLKQRVDARPEHWQHPLIKIIISVGFTFVVFLLPTTTVYYSVFVLIRICLRVIQGFASVILWALNSNPVSISVLHLSKSKTLKGIFHLELEDWKSKSGEMEKTVKLHLKLTPSPLEEALSATYVKDLFPPMPTMNLGYIGRSLVYGQLLL